jgi:hypothetical protein
MTEHLSSMRKRTRTHNFDVRGVQAEQAARKINVENGLLFIQQTDTARSL